MIKSLTLALSLSLGSAAYAGVSSASYSEPTTRYDHAILGDAIEYGAIKITTDAGQVVTLRLPDTRVFEDIAPRLVDVDSDGDFEIVAIETSLEQGARLAVYDEAGFVAATPFIGRTHRWLAPIGAGDLDGDGAVELAYIDRPHLAKTLRVWRFQDGALIHVVDQPGLTNHRIGDDFMSSGLRHCGGLFEMITVNANWSRIIGSKLQNGRVTTRDLGPFQGLASVQQQLLCK